MTSSRTRTILFFPLVVFLVIAGILYFILSRRPSPLPSNTAVGPATVTEGEAPAPTAQTAPSPAQPKESPASLSARQTARMFVERFRSFSTTNGNAHIADVLPIATAKMASWIQSQKVSAGEGYRSMTTRVVASTVTALSDARAAVAVDVQEVDQDGKISYRSGRVELLKDGDGWNVDGLYWNP